MKFGKLILRKIIKTVATRCHILKLKCIKFDFGWGSAPDSTGGSLHRSPGNRSPGRLAEFKGAYF